MTQAIHRKDRCSWCGLPLAPSEGMAQQVAHGVSEFCSERCQELWHQRMAQMKADHLGLVKAG
jgi:predicted nucleic acid-binding Zn ribbon protein